MYKFGPPDREPDREGFVACNPDIDWTKNTCVSGWDRLRQCYDYIIVPNEVLEKWRASNGD